MLEFNIGLEVGRDGEKIPAIIVSNLVRYAFPLQTEAYDEDNTLVVKLGSYSSIAPVRERILWLARLLAQDCIAVYDGSHGELIGDRAHNWEPFDLKFFKRYGGK